MVHLSPVNANYRHSSSNPVVCHSFECFLSAANFKQNMNLSVDPCDDFYSYVCGHWADHHRRSKYWKSYDWHDDRQIKIDYKIRDFLETNISQSDPKPVAQTKTMYKACLRSLNTTVRYRFRAVKKYLKEFGLPTVPTLLKRGKGVQTNNKFDWISSVAKIQRKLGINVLIGLQFTMDERIPDQLRLALGSFSTPKLSKFPWYAWSALQPIGHGSITQNEKLYKSFGEAYTRDDQQNVDSYAKQLALTFNSLIALINHRFYIKNGNIEFLALAKEFLVFEKQLPVLDDESKDEESTYYTAAELQNITDSRIIPRKPYPVWQHYFDVLFADLPAIKPAAEKLLIKPKNVKYLGNLIDFLSQQPPELIELYIWQTVTEFFVYHPFNKLRTEEKCMKCIIKLMGVAISYSIADTNFLKQTKPRVEQMFNDIRSEFNQMVLETDWIDMQTKKGLVEKSNAMEAHIGFPEWILNVDKLEEHYRGLRVNRFRHFENWVNALQILSRTNLQLLHENIRNILNVNPKQVNAYSAEHLNLIRIPVGIIQYPFYYLGLEALNYGSLGSTLGHELTHGFAGKGRHHDKFGNNERWWSNETLQEYDDRARCLVEQYNSYFVPEANDFVNGTLTLDENIADIGGVREALGAYRRYVKRNGPEPLLPGFEDFTHEQLFFISYGNTRCATLSSLDAKEILEDPHSPPRFRVLGVLSNMEEFSEAFQCPRGSRMNPEKKCRVW